MDQEALWHVSDVVVINSPMMPCRRFMNQVTSLSPGKNALVRILVAVTLVLSPFVFATSPLPPPYHQYHVQGTITRPAGASLKNFSIVLLAKGQFIGPAFQVLKGRGVQYERPISLTDSIGGFILVVSSDMKADSLAVGVVMPDRPIAMSSPLSLNSIPAQEQTETHTTYNDATCSGCTSPVDKTTTIVVAYKYYLPMQVVALTW